MKLLKFDDFNEKEQKQIKNQCNRKHIFHEYSLFFLEDHKERLLKLGKIVNSKFPTIIIRKNKYNVIKKEPTSIERDPEKYVEQIKRKRKKMSEDTKKKIAQGVTKGKVPKKMMNLRMSVECITKLNEHSEKYGLKKIQVIEKLIRENL